MSDLVVRLEGWLRERRPAYLARLEPGASGEQIRALERAVGAGLPEEFAALYRWRDGQSPGCYKALHDNFMFSPLAAAGRARKALNDLLDGGEFDRENWWRPGWVPFLDNGGGDHLCLDLEGTFTGRRGQVLEFRHDDAERAVLFPDFASYLEALVRSLEETEWEEGEQFWEMDRALAARVSPGHPKRFKAGG